MASINYEHSLNEKILVIYEHDSFDGIQELYFSRIRIPNNEGTG